MGEIEDFDTSAGYAILFENFRTQANRFNQ